MNKDKLNKKQSQENIGMPKTDYKKALEYYNLEGKSAKTIASRLKIKPKLSSGKKNVSLKEQIETELVKRWKDDSKKVEATYNLTFQRYDKKTKKYSDGVIKFNVRGEKRDIPKLAEKLFESRVESLMEDYDEWKDFDYYQSGDLINIEERKGSGTDNGKTITTIKGGQRKVGMKGHKAVIKMRDRFALKFADGEWDGDRGEGTCVFDYLYENYKCKEMNGTKTKPKKREDAYKWLDELLRIDETEKPLRDGVSVYQLENFCDEFSCNMYVYDETDGLIEYYSPKKKSAKKDKPLIFRVFDGHFQPIPDNKRGSATAKAANTTIRSNDIETFEDKKKEPTEKKKYEVIAPTQEEYDSIKEDLKAKNYPVSVRNQIAINYIKKNGMKIPYPLTESRLVVDEGSIVKLRYDDKIVLTEPINPKLKKWYEDNDEEYNGEGYINIMNRIWMNKYGFLPKDAPFLSKMNVEVSNALNANKVKWRTHLGLTEEGEKYSKDNIIEMLQTGEAISVDICKCYCDALYNPIERWIVFNGKEQLEVYDKKPLTLGLYFVITNDMTLFHKSNWYSKQIIMKAKEEGIYYKITHQIRCVDIVWEKEKLDAENNSVWKLDNLNLFQPIIDEIVELTEQDEDFTITKIIINAISGYLGKTNYKTKTASMNTKLSNIWENWIVKDEDKVVENGENLYINEVKDGDNSFYIYGVETQTENLSTGLPMYIQVLDSANIALYDMTKAVGGTCIYRKTDCIVSIGGKLPEDKTAKYPCSYQETWGKYRLVDDAENYNYDVVMNIYRAVETPRLSQDWEYWDFNDSADWERILDTAISKGGMLISGRAGTGKSYIIKKGIEKGILSADKQTRMSFTNRAARNIDGTTIHKNMAINQKNKTNSRTLQSLKKYNIFVIDEISMIYAELWNKLCLLKKATGAIFILLGDYRQCPPIEDGKEIDYFNHPYAKYLANYNTCELTKPQRYDMPLWNWLEDFYEEGKVGDKIPKKKLTIDDILYRKNICYTNKTRKRINQDCMKHIISEKSYTPICLNVNEKILIDNPYADDAYLYVGLPVMAVKNNCELEIINSEEFWLKEINTNESILLLYRDEDIDMSEEAKEKWCCPVEWARNKYGEYTEGLCNRCNVKPDTYENYCYSCDECGDIMEVEYDEDYKEAMLKNIELIEVSFKDFHKNFVVNYASTTHKSQGATITKGINIWDWYAMEEDKKLGYTAISRAKNCEQVCIVSSYDNEEY